MLTQFMGPNRSRQKKESRIWFAGLHGAGKTSAIYKLKLGECIQTQTNSMSVIQETFSYRKRKFIFWEIGNISFNHHQGQDTYTKEMKHIIFRHYYQQTKVIIFFIDSSDKQQILDSKQELQNIARIKCLDKIPIIVFCNKQDLLSHDDHQDIDHHSDSDSDFMEKENKHSNKSKVFTVEEIAEMIDLQNLLRVHQFTNGVDSKSNVLTVGSEEKKYDDSDLLQSPKGKGNGARGSGNESVSDYSTESMRSHENQHYLLMMGGSVLSGDGLFELLDKTHHILGQSPEDTISAANNGDIDIHLSPEKSNDNDDDDDDDDGGNNTDNSHSTQEVDERVGNWLERQQEQNDHIFIQEIKDNILEEPFDHYNLIRLIWIYHKARKSMQDICDLIEAFQKEEYNVTTIYFWSQITLYSLESIQDQELRDRVREDFRIFVACNPEICDPKKLLKEYYTKEMLFKTLDDPQTFIMPNIKPLPSLITNVQSLKELHKKNKSPFRTKPKMFRLRSKHRESTESGTERPQHSHSNSQSQSKSQSVSFARNKRSSSTEPTELTEQVEVDMASSPRRGSSKRRSSSTIDSIAKLKVKEVREETVSLEFPGTESDQKYLEMFQNGQIAAGDMRHVDFIRIIWCYFRYHDTRKAQKLMELKFKEIQRDLYHETLSLFWVHMVQYFVTLLQNEQCVTFMEFWTILSSNDWSYANSVRYNLHDQDLWKEFYSPSVMHHHGYNQMDASVHLVLPDVGHLPSAVCYYTEATTMSPSAVGTKTKELEEENRREESDTYPAPSSTSERVLVSELSINHSELEDDETLGIRVQEQEQEEEEESHLSRVEALENGDDDEENEDSKKRDFTINNQDITNRSSIEGAEHQSANSSGVQVMQHQEQKHSELEKDNPCEVGSGEDHVAK